MSKEHLPGSMDLLLDTMCNTFGGVVFIALTLSLAFLFSQSRTSPAEDIEKIKQELIKQQQEFLVLQAKRNGLTEKLSSVKDLSSKFAPAKSGLPEIVTRLEQEHKEIRREAEIQNIVQTDLQRKISKTENENKQIRSAIREKKQKIAEDTQRLTEDNRKLSFIVDELNEKLRQTPVTKFHFAHNERTSKAPYVLVVKNDRVYRLGADYLNSSSEVKVKRDGNTLLLTLQGGTFLPSIGPADLRSLLKDFNKSSGFLWVLVHPDSFDSFVVFRRLLRNADFPVFWYIETGLFLHLGYNPNYSASK